MEQTTAVGMTQESRTMRAIVQTRYGSPLEVLEPATINRPRVRDDNVLVRLRATSINTPDWLAVTGIPKILRVQSGLRRPKTPVRGTDIAGVVESVGPNVSDLRSGDEVFGSTWANSSRNEGGTFSEYTRAPESQLSLKPAAMTFEQAAASVMSGITALIAMRDVAKVGPGASVLVNGASGGVGTFAVQIARSMGATVTGVCSTNNVELVRSLGATHVIDYTQEDFTMGSQRYDAILDNVLNHSPTAVIRALNPGGMLLPNSIGTRGGWFAGLPRMAHAMIKGLGGTQIGVVDCEVNRENLEEVAALTRSGEIEAVIGATYPLHHAAQAVHHMAGRHARGNLVVVI